MWGEGDCGQMKNAKHASPFVSTLRFQVSLKFSNMRKHLTKVLTGHTAWAQYATVCVCVQLCVCVALKILCRSARLNKNRIFQAVKGNLS